MDLTQTILAAAICIGVTAAAIKTLAVPLKVLIRVAANTLLGLGALLLLNSTSALTGLHLGLNLFNAAVVGVLGIPGLVLLLLAQWVLV